MLRKGISNILSGEIKGWKRLWTRNSYARNRNNSGNPQAKISVIIWSYLACLAWKLLKSMEIIKNKLKHTWFFFFIIIINCPKWSTTSNVKTKWKIFSNQNIWTLCEIAKCGEIFSKGKILLFIHRKVASRSTCYYSENQVFGGATNREMSLNETCFYSKMQKEKLDFKSFFSWISNPSLLGF